MPRKRKATLIDKTFCSQIGEVVVEFGRLEDSLRCSTAEILCPAIGYPDHLAIFARTRFSELVDLYEFGVLWAVRRCEDDEKITSQNRQLITEMLRLLKSQLTSVNERRNNIVHSTYQETVDHDVNGPVSAQYIEAKKPVLHRRVVEVDYDQFYRSQEVLDKEMKGLISETKAVYQKFLAFDQSIVPYTNWMWSQFCEWYTAMRAAGTKSESGGVPETEHV
jgi:hypothetical protein